MGNKPEFWKKDDKGIYWLQKQFAWMPVAIEGEVKAFRYYWEAWLTDNDGNIHSAGTTWNDPRKNDGI